MGSEKKLNEVSAVLRWHQLAEFSRDTSVKANGLEDREYRSIEIA